MMNYSQKDIDEAKAFILRRVKAEISMQNHLDESLLWAAKEIIAISYKYHIKASLFKFSTNSRLKSEVDNVLARLREMLYEYTETLAVSADEDDDNDIIAFINGKTYGHTLKERINIYTNRYSYELEAFIASGLLQNLSKDKLLSSVRANMSTPYNNSLFRNSVIRGGMAATRIHSKGITYGQGHSNSARNLLNTLTRNIIAGAWMWVYGNNAKKNGAIGFYSFRGSSYQCNVCDEAIGYHPIEEYRGYWHLNCRCYFVFVYNN